MNRIKVTTIEITGAGEEPIRLTMEEARDLYAQLKGLFGDDSRREIIIERDRWPVPWSPYRPIWSEAKMLPSHEPRIMCKASASGLAVSYLGEKA